MAEVESTSPSFGRLVFGKALADTGEFLKYTKRDFILGGITLAVGGALAYVFVGKADTLKELAFIAAFTFAPAGIVMIAVFIWHLWLAPSALAYEAACKADTVKATPLAAPEAPKPVPPAINWAIWKQRASYDLKQFAAILAKTDPTKSNEPPDKAAFVGLLSEAAMKRELSVSKSRYANSYAQPDLYPDSFEVQKADAVKWAESKGFDVAHIK